jgi:hypothetical protein
MNQTFSILKHCLCALLFAAIVSSCDDKRYEEIYGDNNKQENENNQAEDNISKKVSQYMSVYASYKYYSWEISITSNLETVYPDKLIKYGILCGYNGEPYYYTKYLTLNGNSITTIEPLFLDGNGSPYINEYFYWKSLVALAEKSSLSDSERMLQNECTKYCNAAESKAKSTYWGQIFAEIDGEKYIVKEYGQKQIENTESSSGNSNNNANDNPSSYEKPEIGFHDYSSTKTSLNVQYRIYNRDEAKVSSAKIYYGTSPNPSYSVNATISGVFIKANISGLKAGTTYYVKCIATGKGGTATTSVTKCLTSYDNDWD